MEYQQVCCPGGTLQGKFQENESACRHDQCLDDPEDMAREIGHSGGEHKGPLSVR